MTSGTPAETVADVIADAVGRRGPAAPPPGRRRRGPRHGMQDRHGDAVIEALLPRRRGLPRTATPSSAASTTGPEGSGRAVAPQRAGWAARQAGSSEPAGREGMTVDGRTIDEASDDRRGAACGRHRARARCAARRAAGATGAMARRRRRPRADGADHDHRAVGRGDRGTPGTSRRRASSSSPTGVRRPTRPSTRSPPTTWPSSRAPTTSSRTSS